VKVIVFWGFTPCRLFEFELRFTGASSFIHHDVSIHGDDCGRISETSVNLYQTARRNVPEESQI
jgi:hypothetical protein